MDIKREEIQKQKAKIRKSAATDSYAGYIFSATDESGPVVRCISITSNTSLVS